MDEYDRLVPEAQELGIPTMYETEMEPGRKIMVRRRAHEIQADIDAAKR